MMAEMIEGAPCGACGKTLRYVSVGKCVACMRAHMKRRNAGIRTAKWSSDKARIQELEEEVRQLRAALHGAAVTDKECGRIAA